MEDQQTPQPRRSFFDDLMFGSHAPHTSSQNNEEVKQTTQQTETSNQEQDDSETTNNNTPPEIDMAQMMQTIDTLMGYADKFGPTLKKMGPLFDLLKGFNSPKK